MMTRPFFLFKVLSSCFIIISISDVSAQTAANIQLNSSEIYQTMLGWEVNWETPAIEAPNAFDAVKNVLFDRIVNDVGINRVRLEVKSGMENPVDYFTPYITGQQPRSFWTAQWDNIINDNNDPFVIDPSGFQFVNLDFKIDNTVLPLKAALEANDESLYINLNYVDFDGSDFEHYNNREEYAEFMLAVFQHMNSKYGFVPDAVEIILEPDVAAGWSASQIANAIVASAERLQANGYTPDFIAPSNTNMGKAVDFFDDMVSVPKFLDYISELSYHRYGGVSQSNLQAIAARGAQHNIRTSMLEWWSGGNSFHTLHEDLKIGNNSAWQQGTVAWNLSSFNPPMACYLIDDVNDPQNPVLVMNNKTKFFRQYYLFVRRGAIRIEATTSNSNFDPLAFINTNGKYVVVIKTDAGGDFSISGLPAGIYCIKYTTGNGKNEPNQYDIDLEGVTIGNDQSLNSNIPQAGVITIYTKSLSTPVNLSFFRGSVQESDVILTWRTSRESGNVGFEVQRSQDNINYESIVFLRSDGNSESVRDYVYIDKNLANGKYYYRLKQVDLNGEASFSGIVQVTVNGPQTFILQQNYPNPFNASTVIRYYVPTASRVKLVVTNLIGQEVTTLVDTLKPAGNHQVTWEANNVGSGVYLYKLVTEDFSQIKKLLLIR